MLACGSRSLLTPASSKVRLTERLADLGPIAFAMHDLRVAIAFLLGLPVSHPYSAAGSMLDLMILILCSLLRLVLASCLPYLQLCESV